MAFDNIYLKMKKNKKRALLIFSSLVLILCCFVLFIAYSMEISLPDDVVSPEAPWTMLGKEIVQGVIVAVLTMLGLYIVNWIFDRKDLEDQHDADMAKRIWNLLKAQKPDDNIITELYSKEAVTDIMRNSASYFSESLANTFCDMLRNQTRVIREDFDYKVSISQAWLRTSEGKSLLTSETFMQEEVLRYRRHFIPSKKEVEIKCCFAFDADTLDTVLMDNSYFFREIISDKDMVKRIVKAVREGNKQDVIKCLALRIGLYRDETRIIISQSELNMTPVLKPDSEEVKGVVFSKVIGTIDENGQLADGGFLSKSENGKYSYKAEIVCKFNIPNSNYFICAFADPLIGHTKFNIKFSDSIIDNVETDVEKFTFLTMGAKTGNPFSYAGQHELSFETSDVIIPTSAIFIQWKAPVDYCKPQL